MISVINSSGTLMPGPSRSTSNPDHTTLQCVDCLGSSRGGPKHRHSFLWQHIFVVDVVLVEEPQPLCDLLFVYIADEDRAMDCNWAQTGIEEVFALFRRVKRKQMVLSFLPNEYHVLAIVRLWACLNKMVASYHSFFSNVFKELYPTRIKPFGEV